MIMGAGAGSNHMVSAQGHKIDWCLGNLKWMKIKFTAIPELIKILLSGCIVTIDAIGCQKRIVVNY